MINKSTLIRFLEMGLDFDLIEKIIEDERVMTGPILPLFMVDHRAIDCFDLGHKKDNSFRGGSKKKGGKTKYIRR